MSKTIKIYFSEETGQKAIPGEFVQPGAGVDLEFETDGEYLVCIGQPGLFHQFWEKVPGQNWEKVNDLTSKLGEINNRT